MRTSDFIIRIPEPCHERWDNMKPDNHGRFCNSCEKVVVDFTGKTDFEIQALLLENAGKSTCGRFKTSQVDRPLSIRLDGEAIRRTGNPRMIFVAAILLVFGSTLFSCYDQKNKKVAIDDIEVHGSNFISGMIAFEPETKDSNQIKEDTKDSVSDDHELKGEVALVRHKNYCLDTHKNDTLLVGENESNTKDSILREDEELIDPVMGRVYTEDITHEIVPPITEETKGPVSQTEKLLAECNDVGTAETLELTVYPNPNTGQFYVRYKVKNRCDVALELLDQEGKTLMHIVDIKSQHQGEYHIPIDLSSYNPNLYLLRLRLGEKQVNSRVLVQR